MQRTKRRSPTMHKLLFDQNLSNRIIQHIEHLFPKSNHVRILKLDKSDDLTIWKYAKENDFHIITQDNDFNDINSLYGYPPKIIRINTGNTSTQAIIELIQNKSKHIQNFLNNDQIGLLEVG